jgi:mannose-6-phosphate isomerase-like protein (cupin superfamily)
MDGLIWDASKIVETIDRSQQQFHRVFERPDLVVGVLRILPGGVDTQGTHYEDEVYAVVGGRGLVRLGDVDHAVAPGSVIFVPQGIPHRFHGNQELLTVAYVLVPPEVPQKP